MKRTILASVLSLAFATSAHALTVAGIDMPDSFEAAGSELALNGAGLREKWMLDLYVGGLYLSNPTQDAKAIIDADSPMAIKMHIVSGLVTSDKMKTATNEGFVNATNGNTAPLQAHIDAFISAFDEEIVENDVYDLVYVPGTGVEIYKNDELLKTIDGGMDFKKAVFGIWLSDKPAQESLKAEMLGN